MSGVDVSILTLGGTVNFLSNQLFLRQALKVGVTCWDTSRNDIDGKSEKGIGKIPLLPASVPICPI
jgi:aryl-alcohol dehydrogenase-like predicted oxidoreductase